MILIISEISITIIKKKIKNIYLYVKPPNGFVTVSAPVNMNDEAIEKFLRTKVSWIRDQQKKFDNQPRQSKREYVSGETLYILGRQYYLQVDYGTKNSFKLNGDKVFLTVRDESDIQIRESFIRECYRVILKKEICQLLPKWEGKTGIQASSWQIKYMTTRWGTCNPKTKKIWINLQLAKKTPECLEYIILHELLHIVEKYHNERFISLMDKYMPMWREIKKTLNDQFLEYMNTK